MSNLITQLQPYNFYHIYNYANGSENLFRKDENYSYFLKLYDKYISPVADTFAWCLLLDHFHLLIRTYQDHPNFKNLDGLEKYKRNIFIQAFSNLFNAYTKAYNKRFERRGSLFCKNFRRNPANSLSYQKQLALHIHPIPVHHAFCDHPNEYPWSSYHTKLANGFTKVQRRQVLNWFNNKELFLAAPIQKSIGIQNQQMFEILEG